ncbi:unnamed protein product [Arctia plantaginis]|uniref:Small RNA 2'-O-methyltransferase n=1 Tax=Arctia plantaginis TaxID=874455 RepID=A0A8S1BKY5_ARCPL|nr:unnamed protein product [Arctia plantaginis]
MIIALQTLIYFRESFFTVLDRVLRPYYKRISIPFIKNVEDSEDEEPDEQVFSEFDDEKGVVFFPPMYSQRYAAVSDCLMDERWRGKLEKVVDFGYHDMSFIKYLKEVPGIQRILGVDIESMPLRCSSDLFTSDEYTPRRESPLQVTLFQGNAADPDYRLIGCDAVIAIEMIEHMLPHDLDRLVHNVFGFIKPWIVVFTTPNGDFNVLFKSLEKNGYRRWDHFFEWSREQFNEWCSNIILRYPNYSVTCQGIGPGPPGTLHYGCCSQLALFVNKQYHKQQDLNFNSLALVPMPNPPPTNDLVESWDTAALESGLQTEIERIGAPYGLNCSTLQVKKFSKTSQNLMAKNKIHSVHTREVVDEIRQLTKTLKFNKCIMDGPEDGSTTWCNINWGDDAPYWNQYYKVVKEYNCPFETKSEECRILDLISEEINHLIDSQCDEAPTCVKNRLEIPLSDLMSVVEHITDDINLVRDILVWNGYEIVDDVVIHSRLVVDTVSVGSQDDEWQDNVSNISDWDNVTEVQSTTVSEGSTIVPDYQDRCLRRALDYKLRNLRTMLTADEDITTELDKIVCKLMKLALRTSTRRTTPPPAKWMQCKLLDLLTLTEKAIQRRKQHVMEDSIKALRFDFVQDDDSKQKIGNLDEMQEDNIMKNINDNYTDTIKAPDSENAEALKSPFIDSDPQNDIMSSSCNGFKDLEQNENLFPNTTRPLTELTAEILGLKPEINPMERTKAWLDVDVEVAPYHNQEMNSEKNSLLESNSVSNTLHKKEKLEGECIANKEMESPICLTPSSKTSSSKYKFKREDKKRKTSSTRVTKKVTKRICPNYNIVKNSDSKNPGSYDSYIIRPKRKTKENQCLTMRSSKPIPESLIDLCNPEIKGMQCFKEYLNVVDTSNDIVVLNQSNPLAVAPEESLLFDIIIDDNTQETIPFCKSTDNNAQDTEKADISNRDEMEEISNDIDVNLCTRHEVSTENIFSQTIFLNDINEPSTSKGIRHNVSMDVQCGPDTLAAYPMLSASTSLVRIPQGFSAGIKIHDPAPDTVQGNDFGTSTHESDYDKIVTPRSRSIGIKIKDSDINIFPAPYDSSMTQRTIEAANRNSGPRSWSPESNMIMSEKLISLVSAADDSFDKTIVLNPISRNSKAECSCCQLCASDGSILKSFSQLDNSTETDSETLLLKSLDCKESNMIKKVPNIVNSKPKLSCGGVYVHSYKDKQESEDIVYQGKWQRCRPKSGRKRTPNTILAKKIYESGNRRQKETVKDKNFNPRDKISIKKMEKKELKVDNKKTLQRNGSILQKVKQEEVTENKRNNSGRQLVKTDKGISSTLRLNRQVINVTKVASKIGMSSITSKNNKSAYTTKKPQLTAVIGGKKEGCTQKLKKNYIPLYMRKRNEMSEKNRLNESMSSVDFDLDQKETVTKDVPIITVKNDVIKKDLLQFQGQITENTYLVFRNENPENCNPSKDQLILNPTNEDNIMQNGNFIKRTRSHQSLNSSTCSSPNSIVTVRAVNTKSKNLTHHRHSASSHRSSLNTSESDNPTPTKTKKTIKRCKTAKRTENNRDTNNKENIPETTENFSSKESENVAKSPFVGQHICITQMKADLSTPLMTSKHKTPRSNKSNIKIPTPEDTIDKKRSLSASVSRKRSRTSSINSVIPNKDTSKSSSISTNMVYDLNTQDSNNVISSDDTVKSLENNDDRKLSLQSTNESNNITHDVKQVIGDLLNSINLPSKITRSDLISGSVHLNSDDVNHSADLNDSFNSFVTVTANYLNSTVVESDKENLFNSTLDTMLGNESIVSIANTRLNVTDLDLLSFKSMTSTSKDSEYFIPESEVNAAVGKVECSQGSNVAVVPVSVTDIFERKENLMQKPPGVLAIQAFSGFSLDGEPVASQQPDPIALVDSETGSLAMRPPTARQTTSEELFISGRSSESYQSCLIDDDAVVPNWLFQIISQQHSQVIEDQPMVGPQPAPMDQESMYDVNGNAIEPGIIDAVAGAGDGRGIHSDQSQDSSGRGTSLSSSDTSSSPHSEAILIDPSTYTAQIELLRDPVTSSALASANFNEDYSREEYSTNVEGAVCHTLTANSRRRPRTFSNEASDISADISSIDTDVPDSDD